MARFKLTLAYDGSPYKGWQRQPQRQTIQGVVEDVLSSLAKRPIEVHGSGRTDAGVHAAGQVAHFDAPSGLTLPAEKWVLAANARLPASIRVRHCEEVEPSFHARFSARQKTYCYTVDTTAILSPFRAGRAWHVPQELSWDLLEESVAQYLGTHCFYHLSALRGNESAQTDYSRTIEISEVAKTRHGFVYTVQAEGFLYKMVRILMGVAVQVATGRLSSPRLTDMLSASISAQNGFNEYKYCAPAAGLRLEKVHYADVPH